jgi:hypothetical protein
MKALLIIGFMFGMGTVFSLYWLGGGDFARGYSLALTAGISVVWGGFCSWAVATFKDLC